MPPSTAIASILAALLVGAMSPGPSFIMVARNAIGLSRRDGLATAVGMGIGGVCFSSLALVGLYSLLQSVEWLYAGLKVAGGTYLLYLAWRIWRGASAPLALSSDRSAENRDVRKSLWIGLSTQLSNPKTAVFYGTVFAALLPQQPARSRPSGCA
jgi:threonine/homoserine/homoserine lactone efflux protein